MAKPETSHLEETEDEISKTDFGIHNTPKQQSGEVQLFYNQRIVLIPTPSPDPNGLSPLCKAGPNVANYFPP